MERVRNRIPRLGVLAALLFAVSSADAQTTGALNGFVTDEQGGVLPGADVIAVHGPTGVSYRAVTGADGTFVILNVRVGPYAVTASLPGFRSQVREEVVVVLGENTKVDFRLQLETVQETVTVTAESSAIYSGSKAGAGTSLQSQVIETLPTLNRSIADYARLSPFVNANPNDEGPANISIAGRPNRYNNIQIDGAVNNDLFGLSDSGTPGGQTESQPISLDAIQELQVVVSPYDVRQGGFAGGGVNAITRTGTNRLRGSGYYYWRDQGLVGDGPFDTPVGEFSDKEGGASLGGPIVKNTAFYFANFEVGRRNTPSGYSVDGQSGVPFGFQAEAQRMIDILQDQYGYDPGGLEQFTRATPNNKFFVRGDFNLGSRNQLVVRHNFIDADNDRGFPSSFTYLMPDFYYQFRSQTNSTVGQLNSTFGSAFNEFRMTYQTVRDNRDGKTEFPALDVRVAGAQFRAGRENFSTANALDQDVIEINDDLTFVRGTHTFTLGTHNEFFKFRNLFIRDNFGTYRFDSLDLLERGLAQSYDYSYSLTGDPQQAAEFSVYQFGFYTGDQWRATPRLTVTYGLRFDYPVFPDKPTRNPASEEAFGYRTDEVPSSPMWSPRAGFNLDLTGAMRQQVRGGIGIFAGRTPYVWLSNQYGNTGIEFQRLSVSYRAANRIPFVSDPFNQPTTVPGVTVATNEIDLVDPDYEFPSILRGNLGYDREVFWHMNASVEFLWGITLNDISYENLNLTLVGTAPDGRPVYNRPGPFSDVIFLTNTTQGDQWSVAFRLDRPFRNGLYASGAYTYGDANSVNDGTSSQAASNWGNTRVPGDPNDPPRTRSHFSPGHRITLSGSYAIPFGRGFSGTASIFYSGQAGRTYSVSFNGDPNGDRRTSNDLMYVPVSAEEVILQAGTWADLDAYIVNDECLVDYRGQIAPRNCARGPWTNTLDFRFALGVPIGGTKLDVTFDLINLLNAFDSDAGVVEYPPFWNLQPVRYVGADPVSGKAIYNLSSINLPKFTTDNLRSRWQGKFGVRWRF